MPLTIDEYQQKYEEYKKKGFEEIYNKTNMYVGEEENTELTEKQLHFLKVIEDELDVFRADCQELVGNYDDYLKRVLQIVGVASLSALISSVNIYAKEKSDYVLIGANIAHAGWQAKKIADLAMEKSKANKFLTAISDKEWESFKLSFGLMLVHRFSLSIEKLANSSIKDFSKFFTVCLSHIIFNKNFIFKDAQEFLNYLSKNITPERESTVYENVFFEKELEFETENGDKKQVKISSVLLDTQAIVEGGVIYTHNEAKENLNKKAEKMASENPMLVTLFSITKIKDVLEADRKFIESMPQRIDTKDNALHLGFLPIFNEHFKLYDDFFIEINQHRTKPENMHIEKNIPDFFSILVFKENIIKYTQYIKDIDNLCGDKNKLYSAIDALYNDVIVGKRGSISLGLPKMLPIMLILEQFIKILEAKKINLENFSTHFKKNAVHKAPPAALVAYIKLGIERYKEAYIDRHKFEKKQQASVELAQNLEDDTAAQITPPNQGPQIMRANVAAPIPQRNQPSYTQMAYDSFVQLYNLAKKPYDFVAKRNEDIINLLGFDPNGTPGTITRGILVAAEMAVIGYGAFYAGSGTAAYFGCQVTTQKVLGVLMVVAVEIIPVCSVAKSMKQYFDAYNDYHNNAAQRSAQLSAADPNNAYKKHGPEAKQTASQSNVAGPSNHYQKSNKPPSPNQTCSLNRAPVFTN